MLGLASSARQADSAALAALGRALAVVEFDLSAKILAANGNFCSIFGYAKDEIIGQPHSRLCENDYVQSAEYRGFWDMLAQGQFHSGEYKRRAKNGTPVYVRATYSPVLNPSGKVVRILKVAADVTQEKVLAAEFEAKCRALSLVQAVIEFTPDGEIIDANANFLNTLGYTLEEIRGQRHRIFVDPAYAASTEYEAFWRKLKGGEYAAGSFRRLAKGGREVWIQASYNPIFDLEGRVVKVVKFANDITDLTRLADGLARVAANDVAAELETPFSPAFEKLRLDFNSTTDTLRASLIRIAHAGDGVRGGAGEIEKASHDLSRRAERQATSLSEAAVALDEVTATVRNMSSGADEACAVVSAAESDAQGSSEIVRNAMSAMGRIEKSASEIGQIIGVIDEIAFQTNLLALNAGVEAARAGEAGRGFAVVASEVRALAQRTAEAARQIKGLIGASSREVGQGVRLVGDAGDALQRIAQRVGKLNEVVQHIAAAAQGQAKALEEVNVAVNEMDQATQQTAAVAEQMTAACGSLYQETNSLQDEVRRFRLERSAAAPLRRIA